MLVGPVVAVAAALTGCPSDPSVFHCFTCSWYVTGLVMWLAAGMLPWLFDIWDPLAIAMSIFLVSGGVFCGILYYIIELK